MSKASILASLESSRAATLDAIEGLSETQMQEPGLFGDWSIKDVLVHLSLWEAELVTLLWQARQGRKPTSAQLGKETVDELNARWHRMHKDRALERVLDDFHAVRQQTVRRVDGFSDQELADRNLFTWLGGEPLARWIAEDSYEHEAEHTAQILAWRESRGG